MFIAVCVRVTAILVTAWLVTLTLRRSAAAARHLVWTCAVGAALLTPALSALPTWRVPLPAALSQWAPSDETGVVIGGSTAVAAPVDSVPVMLPGAVSQPANATEFRMTALAFAAAIWTLGCGAILLHLLSGIVAMSRLRRCAATRPAASWTVDAHGVAADLGIARVSFAESDRSDVPFVCGVITPLVIMPATASSWTSERRRVVLLHELAHVKRRDCLTQLLARITVAIYWFNPLVWVAAHRLHVERERACDDVVLTSGVRGSDYAGHLVAIANAAVASRSPFAAAGVAMARRGRLERRLMSILDPQLIRTSRRSTRLAVGAFGVVALATASLHVQAQAPVQARFGAQTARPSNPTFEVASIKRNKEVEAARAGINPNVPTTPGRAQTLPGGRLLGRGMTVRELIRDAYGYRNRAQGDIVGGPGWIDVERYDVEAKAEYDFPPSTSMGLPPPAEAALRALLTQRFNLIARVESSIRPVYELVLHRRDGQLGSGLTPSKGGCRPFFQREAVNAGLVIAKPGADEPAPLRPCPLVIAPGIIRAENMTMADWVRILALTPQLNRTVVDRTGLTGGFDILIKDQEAARTGPMDLLPPIKPPLESQLGLTVRDAEAPVETLVIEQVERPSEN
jgi:uncharacterized protein (TIGR03435 family)